MAKGSIRIRRRSKSGYKLAAPPSIDVRQLALELASQLRPETPASPRLEVLAAPWLPLKTRDMASARDFIARVRDHLLPHLGHHTDQTLKKANVDEWVAVLAKKKSRRGTPLSSQTIRHVWDAGRQLVNDARANGQWSGPNAFEDAGAPKVRRCEDPDTLTVPEASALLRVIPAAWSPLFAAALYIGSRRKQLFAARKTDVDRDGWVLDLAPAKTSRRLLVPLPDELVPYIRLQLALNPNSEWLFSRPGGRRMRGDTKTAATLRRALADLGIRKNITFHGLRRVSSSLHQEAGCHPWVVSRILGHAQSGLVVAENTTARRYTKLSLEFARRELNRLRLRPEPGF